MNYLSKDNTISILYLANEQNNGDKANAEGIANLLAQNLEVKAKEIKLHKKENDPSIEEISPEDMDNFNLIAKGNICVIASGLHGAKVLIAIKTKFPHLNIFWSGHMLYDEVKENISKFTSIYIPSHIQAAFGHKISRQFGVPFIIDQKREENATKEAQEIINQAKAENKKIVVVQLGGDVVDLQGKECAFYYSAEEAKNLAHYLIKKYGTANTRFIISNCARTGKYNTQNPMKVDNDHKTDQVDQVTQAFIEALEQNQADKKLYNFVIGKPNGITLGMKITELEPQADYYVGTESTSLGSEIAIRNIKSKQIYLCQPEYLDDGYKELNTLSQKKIYEEYKSFIDEPYKNHIGTILSYFNNDFKEILPKQLAKNPDLKHPTDEIAIKISKTYLNKENSKNAR